MTDYSSFSDQELVAAMRGRDGHAAFTELYHRFSPLMLAYAYRITQDEAEAQEVVQTIFVELWTKREGLHIQGAVFNYLMQAVRFGFYKALRSRQTFAKYEAELQRYLQRSPMITEEAVLERELLERLEKLADAFPETMGKVFVMTYFHHRSPAEIAQALNLSEGTVRNLLSQSAKRAKIQLGLAIALFLLSSQGAVGQHAVSHFKKNTPIVVKNHSDRVPIINGAIYPV